MLIYCETCLLCGTASLPIGYRYFSALHGIAGWEERMDAGDAAGDAGARGAQRSLPPAQGWEGRATGPAAHGDTGNNAAASFRGSKLLELLRERPHDNDL